MTSMESIFEIPYLYPDFEDWSHAYPEVAALYLKVSDARDLYFLPDADMDDDNVPYVDVICNNGVDYHFTTVLTKKDFVIAVDYYMRKYANADYQMTYVGSIDNLPDK